MHIYHVGVSGGKDSQALLLWTVKESGLPLESIRATFCNTHNEDEVPYEHVRKLGHWAEENGVPGGIAWLEPDIEAWKADPVVQQALKEHPELDNQAFFLLALKKRRFPSRKAQFCTDHLKIRPTGKWVRQMQEAGHTLTMLSGVRADESFERSKLPERDPPHMTKWGAEVWRPLLKWTIEDVYAISKKYGIELNPLYALGARRVGCFPCINCAKREVRLVAKNRPEKIDAIRVWEKTVGEHRSHSGYSSFFPAKTVTANFRRGPYLNAEGEECYYTTIDDVVAWANTKRGGKEPLGEDEDVPSACSARLGQCE